MNRLVTSMLLGCSLSFVLTGCGGGVDAETKVMLLGGRSVGKAAPVPRDDDRDSTIGYGSIRGLVKVKGGLPERTVRFAQGEAPVNPRVCAADTSILHQSPVIGPKGGLANVFFYLKRKPEGAKQKAGHMTVENGWSSSFNNRNCTFEPHAQVVLVGDAIDVSSDDAVRHNVHTFPRRNREHNFAFNQGTKETMAYARPEQIPVRVKCDIHAWMTAYHLPVDHPYAAVTGKDGTFHIQDVPAGPHKFTVWHEQFGSRTQEVEVIAGQETNVEITVTADQLSRIVGEDQTKTIVLSLRSAGLDKTWNQQRQMGRRATP